MSNYTEKHLEELLLSSEIKPMVNQVEVHPWLVQAQLRDMCKRHGVVVQAYSPLGVGSVCTLHHLLSPFLAVFLESLYLGRFNH